MSKAQTIEAQTAPNTPFSAQLIGYINGVYSTETSVESFISLINYLRSGNATVDETNFLIETNNNPIVHLLNSLRNSPRAHEELRSTVDQLVTDATNAELDSYTESDADMDADSDATEPQLYENLESDIDSDTEQNAYVANNPDVRRRLNFDNDNDGDVEMTGDLGTPE